MPIGCENQVEELVSKLEELNSIDNWHFVFAKPEEIQILYTSLKLKETIQTDLSAKNVFIIDKKLNLRGRKAKTFVEVIKMITKKVMMLHRPLICITKWPMM